MTILVQGRWRSSSVTRFYSERSRRVDLDAISAGSLSMPNGVLRGDGSYSLTSVAFSEGKRCGRSILVFMELSRTDNSVVRRKAVKHSLAIELSH